MKITLENICKAFGSVKAVNNLNLEIDDGDLISILGPSGCGKSTTLSLIAGLLKPDNGDIYFGDKKVTNIEPEDRGIGMVFQNYALYPHMSVLKNIMFPLKMKKMNRKEANRLATQMAELTKIEDLLHRKPSELSGGQQQRVAIARALVKKPEILLLDEPLSNLDARLRIEMREEIRRIQQEVKITTIFVTHDQEEAMSISDKILLMKDGLYQQYTTPKEMYSNPSNKFVARFLGNPPINFIEAEIMDNKEDIKLHNSNIILNLSRHLKDREIREREITLGIRPEDLIITNKDEALFSVEVTGIQIMGKEIYIIANIDEGIKITLVVSWDFNIDLGDRLYLDVKNIHIFHRGDVC
ncbi:ABC transporter ATP-binding protein [Tissierella sp. MB52-C2]|uniref:ABC transporter ATP-binding protein n=1 Tax=Tissierella sp. MB52-C2 TaxID=3070999 RepID=UPI00280AFB9B|nr:ABC transporter ATP-binding protein [Tissierella sp. MB52-C2]WMM25892.1 ABC transporter ATP-binding protein [Tissierella sp. MB52-C2]